MTVPNICTPAAPIIAVRCWRPHANAIFCSSWWRPMPKPSGNAIWPNSPTSPLPRISLSSASPPSESVRAAGTATCCSTNIRTPPPRRPLCWQHCSTWMRHRGPPSTRWVIRSSRFTHGVVPALVHSVCSSKISTCLPDTSHSRCPSPGETAV